MGKKKPKKGSIAAADPTKTGKDTQAQKSYSFSGEKLSITQLDNDDDLMKVDLPRSLETTIVDLIKEHHQHHTLTEGASHRLTAKKLTDMYMSLVNAGFKQRQIEDAMGSTVPFGGDLVDALDWLCLNTNNDQLPEGFSQTFCEEERKTRPTFCETQQESAAAAAERPPETTETSRGQREVGKSPETQVSMKDWILQYADQDEDEDEEADTETSHNPDPNEQYLVLTAKLLDAKTAAAAAKRDKNKSQQQSLSLSIRQYIQEMDQLEKHRSFNPAIKIRDIDEDKREETPSEGVQAPTPGQGSVPPQESGDCAGQSDLGLAMFNEEDSGTEKVQKPKMQEAKVKAKVNMEKRVFAYTRQQWTGKSPKQFLIDWIRKHLPKSPAPSFRKVEHRGSLFQARVRVVMKEGDLTECPQVLCENVKEAEHLAATLALYRLCQGQSVYQLLPPPYRDIWLEWLDSEKSAAREQQDKKDKPRDMFVTKLMKKLKVTATTEKDVEDKEEDEDVEESWEDLASDEESYVTPSQSKTKTTTVVSMPTRCATHVSGDRLRELFLCHQQQSCHQDLLATRSQLPVSTHRDAILDQIQRENVVLIAGETGSGKSTQIPQFILEAFLQCGLGDKCNIVCTEPRRVSAVSLAMRVSEELGDRGPGERDSFCGYQIRFESKKCETTRLTYCTTGVLLRRLQQDPLLKDISHIIVDEVHERSVQSDFLLVILRRLLQEGRRDLKVILMSATLDADKFSAYFHHCPVVNIPGRTFPVDVHYLEDVVELTSYQLERDSQYALREDKLLKEEHSEVTVTGKRGEQRKLHLAWTKEDLATLDLSGLSSDSYSLRTRNVVTRLREDRINMELLMELLRVIPVHPLYKNMEGAILVFLPGLSHIVELNDLILADRQFSNKSKYWVLSLHSVLTSHDQKKAFTIPPRGITKIVLATNIAETGITIPDVVFVIDSGKVKETRYVESSQMSALDEVYVSKASAEQRQGRAGRVREGVCFRLYTRHKFLSLRKYTVPEMLRVPLEELCLHIMQCHMGHPAEFLAQALDPPHSQTVSRAMCVLREVGACTYEQAPSLTPLGQHLAALPVNVRVGKMLIFGAIFGCLDPVAVIAAAMTNKSPFMSPLDRRDQANTAKGNLAIACSDHLTVYRAYLGWRQSKNLGLSSEVQYCQKHFLKRTALLEIENVSRDLVKLIRAAGFADVSMETLLRRRPSKKSQATSLGPGHVLNISETDSSSSMSAVHLSPALVAVLKAVLTAGLYPNVAQVVSRPTVESAAMGVQETCVAQTQYGLVHAHPSSVNRYLAGPGWLIFHEKVKLSCVYLRDSTLISPYPILLFGGTIEVQHKQMIVSVDDSAKFKAYAKTAVIFKELRLLINEVLTTKLLQPHANISDNDVVSLLLDLIVTESERAQGKRR